VSHIAKLFWNGRSQAVRLPSEFRFAGDDVYVRRDPATGDVILSSRADDWDTFFALVDTTAESDRTATPAPTHEPV
jgi:antitoxin VapB